MGGPSVAQIKISPDKKERNSSPWGAHYELYRYFSLCENCPLEMKTVKLMGYVKTNSKAVLKTGIIMLQWDTKNNRAVGDSSLEAKFGLLRALETSKWHALKCYCIPAASVCNLKIDAWENDITVLRIKEMFGADGAYSGKYGLT